MVVENRILLFHCQTDIFNWLSICTRAISCFDIVRKYVKVIRLFDLGEEGGFEEVALRLL
jgi:hypothetical protein